MEETGQIVKGRRPALLEVRKSLLAAAYDVFFLGRNLAPQGVRLFFQRMDCLLQGGL